MFYIIKNVIRNTKCANDVKSKFLLNGICLKHENEINHKLSPSCYSHSNLFFNDVSINLENIKNKENNILLFNKVRNDKRHRKRGFQKRGYWKKMHYFVRKSNMMCFAFKVQNIDYEKIKKLKRGEIYSN
ncbi:hypothetical protein YYC_05214 [Plasmodium yoelii 17X]|uniref:Uncharacterized protein n=4 Tax=Plasmodium yoelii TaxID=5861 RepID=A0AAE9WTW4_PLAYO|nr:conserved protein, unknown function [Plasmodium yoelii]EAA19640.1 hypothetical protein [Plasmodium yoelii yoelii]ETB56845.1 hypothetical protein YYC_05214 [Plasmodium yoelii 17X]WBY58505.1 hypothetical protein Py17XNL_001105892 [Plasmodium yoelii yoelii]CDU18820.1 conserved Plasmodium protein, unknown function [Plasmodium yoelii]VTZ79405.1 conserved protein, unknown function [Plasmodium yoelii]|eukprot:XP_728075.1 conserved protein, unknown function [Plasmodium yoelii]